MQINLSNEQVDNLRRALEIDIDRAEAHLDYLMDHTEEPDREAQRIEMAAAITHGEATLALLG